MSSELTTADPALARLLLHAEAGLRRVSCEVGGEQVTVFLRQGKLRTHCTCAIFEARNSRDHAELRASLREPNAEPCEHHKLAMSLLGLDAGGPASETPQIRSSLRPPPPPILEDITALTNALDDLCLAMARTGLDAPDSPSIREALDQVIERAPKPPSLTLARWVGRVSEALAVGEVGKLARLLDGAQHLVQEARTEKPSARSLSRLGSWLGRTEPDGAQALADTNLVEIGREWLTGTSRASLERRYLVDLHNGEIYSEERRRGEQDASVGPCPRVVQLAYGDVDDAVQPRRVRMLQYTLTPEVSQAQWRRVTEFARAKVSELAAYYASTARRAPGTSEPFVLFSPAQHKLGLEPAHVRDDDDAGLELVDDGDVPMTDTLRAMADGADVIWIAGRLTGLSRGLVLRPTSMLLQREGRFSLRRVT